MNNSLTGALRTDNNEGSANAGAWSLDENLAYTIFIDINKKSMTSKKKMRQMEFYDKLSAFIGTRTSSQCRSHHQKLFCKYKYLTKIREVFRNEITVPVYKAKLKDGLDRMESIERNWESVEVKVEEPEPQIHVDEAEHDEDEQEEPMGVPMFHYVPVQSMMFGYGLGSPMEMMGNIGWMSMDGTLQNPFLGSNNLM